MDNTIVTQGKFISTGNDQYISLPSGVDWFNAINYDASLQTVARRARTFFWQKEMGQDAAFYTWNEIGSNSSFSSMGTGISYYDSSSIVEGSPVAVTGVTHLETPPQVTAEGHGFVTGNVVRMYSIAGAQQLGGYDFSVTYVDPDSFTLTFMPAITVAGTVGYCRRVQFVDYFYPSWRTITKVTKAANAVVTFSVQHSYTVGQQLRLSVPADFGMSQLNGRVATILAVNYTLNTVTINIDTTSFTTFAFPAPAQLPFSPAIAAPLGESLTVTHNLDDATTNVATYGVKLTAGAMYPAGLATETIYWQAGKAFSTDN